MVFETRADVVKCQGHSCSACGEAVLESPALEKRERAFLELRARSRPPSSDSNALKTDAPQAYASRGFPTPELQRCGGIKSPAAEVTGSPRLALLEEAQQMEAAEAESPRELAAEMTQAP